MNTDEAIRILGETKLLTPLGQAAAVGIEAIKENTQLIKEIARLAIESVEREKQLARLEAEVQRWAEAEKDGRLIALPLAEGTPFYEVRTIFGEVKIIKHQFERTTPQFYIDYIGKTVFLTRKEAEAALKAEGVE